MATFVFVHGAGMSGWSWHLVTDRLTAAGHWCAAPDLTDAEDADLTDYARAIVDAIPGPGTHPVIVVGHSWGAFPASLAAQMMPGSLLVLVGAMLPSPGECPGDWWEAVGHDDAVREQAARDGGLTGNSDDAVQFHHDVPPALAAESERRWRNFPAHPAEDAPWPADALVAESTRVLVTSYDRCLPPELQRRLAAERAGIDHPDEIATGHMPMLARPEELADRLAAYAAELPS